MENKYLIDCVAITGITGTLGCALTRECLKNGIKILAFINPGSKNENRIPDSPLITKLYCSLDEMKEYETDNLKADVFIHLAWASTNRMLRNMLEPQIDNIKFSLDSVDLAKRLGCKVYIGAGSQAEYGNVNGTINESTITNPKTAYGIAKLCSGQMTRLKCKSLDIRHVWTRIFSTYGPYTQDTTIVNYTIASLLKEERASLTKCEQVWDFLYVDDAAKALLLLADNGKDGEVYCISSGQSRTLKEYLSEVGKKLGKLNLIGFGDLPYGNDTVMHLSGDITKLQKETGFTPDISFENGIIKTIEWARKYYSNKEI